MRDIQIVPALISNNWVQLNMSMANMNHNAMPTEASMTLIVHMLINGKEILMQALCNEEVAKGVLTGWTNMQPKRVQALNETTFLATFAAGILAEEVGTAIEKIDNWLGNVLEDSSIYSSSQSTLSQWYL